MVAASQAMKLPLNETGHFLPLVELSLLGFINFERNKLPSFFFLQKVGFFSDFLSQSFGIVKITKSCSPKPSNCLSTQTKALRIAWLENFKDKCPIVCVCLWRI